MIGNGGELLQLFIAAFQFSFSSFSLSFNVPMFSIAFASFSECSFTFSTSKAPWMALLIDPPKAGIGVHVVDSRVKKYVSDLMLLIKQRLCDHCFSVIMMRIFPGQQLRRREWYAKSVSLAVRGCNLFA